MTNNQRGTEKENRRIPVLWIERQHYLSSSRLICGTFFLLHTYSYSSSSRRADDAFQWCHCYRSAWIYSRLNTKPNHIFVLFYCGRWTTNEMILCKPNDDKIKRHEKKIKINSWWTDSALQVRVFFYFTATYLFHLLDVKMPIQCKNVSKMGIESKPKDCTKFLYFSFDHEMVSAIADSNYSSCNRKETRFESYDQCQVNVFDKIEWKKFRVFYISISDPDSN